MHLLLRFRVWRIYRFFLKEGSHLSLFDIFLLLILGLYVVHWIGLSLSFSKSPSLLKSESRRKSYHRFHRPSFSVGANPALTGIFTGRPAQGRRNRDVRWGGPRRAQRAPGFHRKPYLGGFPAQAQRSPGCAPAGPA
jgi:hypothetical protein